MKRRDFIAGGLALGAAGMPCRSVAQMVLGNGTLTTISDGTLALPLALPKNVPDNELQDVIARFGLMDGEMRARPLNVTLWEDGDRLVLFDAGSGPVFVDTAGALYENLDAAGYALDQVTDVIFTHAHPDHIWGIVDDFDEIAFPEARLWIGQKEFDFWMDPGATELLDEARQFFAVGARRRLEAISETVELFDDGDEVITGVTARASYGHTPGHMSFVVGTGDDQFVVLGDAVANGHVQFARPDWESANDQNPGQAAETRAVLLNELAASGSIVTGYHLPGNGIGRVRVEGGGYAFVPA